MVESLFSLLFLGLLGYGVYWLFGRPKDTTRVVAENSQVRPAEPKPDNSFLKDTLEYPRFFGLSLVAILVAFNIFAYDVSVGIGVAIMQAVAAGALFLCLPRQKKNWLSVFMTGLAVASALAIGFRANGFVQSVNSVVYTLSMLMILLLLVVDQVQWTMMWIIRYVAKGFISSFGHVFRLFNYSTKSKSVNFSLGAILKTTIITVVVLAFFVGLLTQADPIFAKLIKDVWEQAIGRVIASVILAIVATVLLTLRLQTLREDTKQPLSFLSFQDVFVPGLAVGIAFGLFLGIQAKYLYGTAVDLQSFGLTLSQYVRKGFIELLMATFFGGLLSYCISLIGRHYNEDSRAVRLKVLNAALITELLLLLLSAWKRNALYMDIYGLTRVRMVGVMFLLWLAGFLVLLLLFAVWKKWSEARLFLGVLLLSTVVFIGLNVQNIDDKIVQASPSHHNFRDYFYLVSLSEDGRAGWPKTIEAAEKLVPELEQKTILSDVDKAQLANIKLALIALTEKRHNLEQQYLIPYEQLLQKQNSEKNVFNTHSFRDSFGEEEPNWIKPQRKWQSWQYSEYEGYKQLASDQALYTDKVLELLERIKKFQLDKNVELYEQEQRLLYELKYPFLSVNLDYYPQSLESMRAPNTNVKPTSTYTPPNPTPVASMYPVVSPVPGGFCDNYNGLFQVQVENSTACDSRVQGSTTQWYECNPGYKNYNYECLEINQIPVGSPLLSASPSPTLQPGMSTSPTPELDLPY